MFTSFHIERFRGIPALDINGVKPITLLVGKNNSGKTSVLEAIFLLCGGTEPLNAVKVASQRGQNITSGTTADATWRSLFYRAETGEHIGIDGRDLSERQWRLRVEAVAAVRYATLFDFDPSVDRSETREPDRIGGVRFFYQPAGQSEIVSRAVRFRARGRRLVAPRRSGIEGADLPASFLSARSFVSLERDAARFSTLVKSRTEQSVLNVLHLIEPKLVRIAVISEASEVTVYADRGGESLIPLAVCGEGMLRLFSIALAVTATKGGVLLIDEIDNGLHHSVMNELWPVLRKLCTEHNVQLIATTHSDETIRDALTAFRDDYSPFALIRLDRTPSGLRAVTYNADAMEGALETNWEVRG